MKKEKSCGAVVYRVTEENGREFLITRNRNGGHWAFPKGHVEGAETEAETALREIREEAGLAPALDTGFREIMTYSPKAGVTKDVVYFAARAERGAKVTIQPEEVLAFRWEAYPEAMALLTFDNDRKLLEEAETYLKKEG